MGPRGGSLSQPEGIIDDVMEEETFELVLKNKQDFDQ